ncbi:hypothetical protein EG68_04539 [Paragonimus skrjabini miyazakii]|uniref:mitogen-activated protein kinase n=1 Tax=Paragonimus skrjabini miyazakii TaxID=59628 RepID=A0A8S9YZC2_9TREM|nr:hypothetical protein EG68_04539 [Paragonimus skrjabini miyazakii]
MTISQAYGIVWKAVNRKTREVVALKKIFDAFRNQTDAQRTFREIAFLQEFGEHPNIITLYNVMRANTDKDIYLVFEYMETDLHNVIKKGNILRDIHKQYVMYQLLKATVYLHSAEVIHRDQKPSNVLLDSDCFVKLCDFGLARSLTGRNRPRGSNGSAAYKPTIPALTEYVATRWYRAPEILLACQDYTKGVDMWSLGCILGEMLVGSPLFPGTSTLDQIERIMAGLPKPSREDLASVKSPYSSTILEKASIRNRRPLDQLLTKADTNAVDLMYRMLHYNPHKRITAMEALKHPYVRRFYSPDDILTMSHHVVPPLDDNVQLSVPEYRNRLYQMIISKKMRLRARKLETPFRGHSSDSGDGNELREAMRQWNGSIPANIHDMNVTHPITELSDSLSTCLTPTNKILGSGRISSKSLDNFPRTITMDQLDEDLQQTDADLSTRTLTKSRIQRTPSPGNKSAGINDDSALYDEPKSRSEIIKSSPIKMTTGSTRVDNLRYRHVAELNGRVNIMTYYIPR